MSDSQQTTECGHPQADMQKLNAAMASIKKKILVLSGKGGVGKSTIAVNLAVELARQGSKVGLLDVDLHGPSIPRMAGLSGQKCFGLENQIIPLAISENLKVMSIAFLIPDDTQAVIWRGPMKYAVIQQLLADTVWGELDYLVIDAPPGTGDEPLSVAQMVGNNAGAVVVTTPQKVAVEDVRRCITFCRQLQLPVWGIIENMAWLTCPHCQEKNHLFGQTSGGRHLAEDTGLELLGSLPIDPQIADGADAGLAIGDCPVSTPVRQGMDQILVGLTKNMNVSTLSKGETKTMKIAIPTAAGQLCMHFGHCEQFVMLTVDTASKTITETETVTPPPHEPGLLPKWLAEKNVKLVIAGGMGQRAQQIFSQNQIEVIPGAPADSPENLVMAYLNNTLQTGANTCDH
jgi:Mrp family chromosome partitioning ATPase/predicted Fe-Mo cluster-binding NifX family protein